MGNYATQSGYRKHDDWYYLEKLPIRLRQALCNSAYPYDTKWFYDRWNKGKSVDWCIQQARNEDLRQALEDVKWRDGFKWQRIKSATKETKVRPLYK